MPAGHELSKEDEARYKKQIRLIVASDGYIFPGYEGIPFRTKSEVPPEIKSTDTKQPIMVTDAKVRLLQLGDPVDLAVYEYIWEQCSRGRFTAPVEEREYDPQAKSWRVFIRFGVRWLEIPK